jgi:hypothetical protein
VNVVDRANEQKKEDASSFFVYYDYSKPYLVSTYTTDCECHGYSQRAGKGGRVLLFLCTKYHSYDKNPPIASEQEKEAPFLCTKYDVYEKKKKKRLATKLDTRARS